MAKTNDSVSISSDIDFIKEFEELKIRQKLLVDTLKKKNLSVQNELFNDINTKLDFLIKIFQEANDSESSDETNAALNSKFEALSEKIDSIQVNFEDKLEKLSSSLVEKLGEKLETLEISREVPKSLPLDKIESDVPPVPNFSSGNSESPSQDVEPVADLNIEDKLEEKMSSDDETKKKKRWF